MDPIQKSLGCPGCKWSDKDAIELGEPCCGHPHPLVVKVDLTKPAGEHCLTREEETDEPTVH